VARPRSGLARLTSRMSRRSSSSVCGRPVRGPDLYANRRGSRRGASESPSPLDDLQSIGHSWGKMIEPGEHQAVNVSKGHSLGRFSWLETASSEDGPAFLRQIRHSTRSPQSVPEFLSTENAIDVRLSFGPFVNTSGIHAQGVKARIPKMERHYANRYCRGDCPCGQPAHSRDFRLVTHRSARGLLVATLNRNQI